MAVLMARSWMLAMALLLGAACGGDRASGAVTEIADLRVIYMPMAGNHYHASGKLDDASPSIDDEPIDAGITTTMKFHDRVGLAARRSWGPVTSGTGAFLWGAELCRDRSHATQVTHDLTGTATMVDGFAGWAWKVLPGLHVEQGVLLGCGQADWTHVQSRAFRDGSTWSSTSTNFVYEYGFTVGAYYTWKRFQIGFDVRHLAMRSRATFTGYHDNGTTTTSWESATWSPKIDIDGLGLLVAGGWRF
jgi:hypothetical protein